MITVASTFPIRRYAALGDSIVAGSTPPGKNIKTGFATEIIAQAGGKLPMLATFNQGVGGERTDQILARVGVLDTIPGLFGVMIDGGVNDLSQSVASQTVKDNILALFNAAWTRGLVVLWLEILPTTAIMATQANADKRADINSYAAGLITAAGGFNARIDTATWNAAANTDDGTHPNETGKPILGALGITALQARGVI